MSVLAPLVAEPMLLGMKWMEPDWLLQTFGSALFWLSLLIVFIECGLFFPFLPGDTLLFAMGLFIGTVNKHGEPRVDIVPGPHQVDLTVAILLFGLAAFAGNVAGYEIGRRIGPRIYQRDGRIIKREYLDRTSTFFEKHGPKALVIGRFVPFVRTYITLVAGVTRMDRSRFLVWSGVGAALWVVTITLAGDLLGRSFPWLGNNIDFVTIGLLLLTVIPIFIEVRRKARHEDAAPEDEKQLAD
ncbi:DedA family protein [Nocardioides panacisoli]|uniref:DedA family protein n=1 Tax=Nocardioides panacisoli TaxID=627624 RepID=UPI0031DDCE48